MHHPSRLILAAAALALASPGTAFAQSSSPMPSSSSAPTALPTTSMPAPTSSPMAAPSEAPATSAPATSAPSSSGSGGSSTNTNTNGKNGNAQAKGKVKKLKTGSLTRSQVLYGLTHQLQAAKQIAKMKTINFDNLRVYKLPSSLKSMVKLSDADAQAITLALLGNGVQVAQTTTSLPSSNGNNSPIQYLRDVLANINVSNALNNLNVLNGSNVNVNLALSNVLNNNKISIGQVVGLYIGGGGIITTITN
jgi:3-oxoacyl-ACP reductase-like protein